MAEISGVQAYYEKALAGGRLEIQLCDSCNTHVFYPRQICPHCGASRLAWISPSGLGTVYSTTTVRINPLQPHDVSLIDLDEGVRLMSRVVNRPAGTIQIGQRVLARIEQQPSGALLVFDALEDAA